MKLTHHARLVSFVSLVCLGTLGCGDDESEPRVVVGFMTDMAIGFDFDYIDRSTSVAGAVTKTEHIEFGMSELVLPREVSLPPLTDGAEIGMSVTAFLYGEASPVLTRSVKTRASSGHSLLLPFSLDAACVGVTCAEGSTCVEGACVAPLLDPGSLAEYDPSWIHSAKDACKIPGAPAPSIEIGQGSGAFASLAENEVVTLEAGPQGGHHVWLALRATGLRQMGSVLSVSGHFPDIPFDVSPFSSQIALHKAGDGRCEIYGVRFQVDRGIDIDAVRGQTLDLEVTLKDPSGDVAQAKKRIQTAP